MGPTDVCGGRDNHRGRNSHDYDGFIRKGNSRWLFCAILEFPPLLRQRTACTEDVQKTVNARVGAITGTDGVFVADDAAAHAADQARTDARAKVHASGVHHARTACEALEDEQNRQKSKG